MNTRQATISSRWFAPIFVLGLVLSNASHASDAGRTAAAGALGGVIGATVGQHLGGQTGAMIGAGIGAGAGGAVASNDKDQRRAAAIGGVLGGSAGYSVGNSTNTAYGGQIGAALGGAGGAALGSSIAANRAREKEAKIIEQRRIAQQNVRAQLHSKMYGRNGLAIAPHSVNVSKPNVYGSRFVNNSNIVVIIGITNKPL